MNGSLSRFALVALVAAPAATGCRTHTKLRPHYLETRNFVARGQYDQAVKHIESGKDKVYKESDRVMYWLNLGTAQHYASNWTESQKNFVAAEKAISDMFTTSVSDEIGTFTVSETVGPYKGEDFEKILLYFYTALNNVKQGRTNDALVEARRADEFLKKIRVRYEQDKELKTLYKEDAFILWLVGLFYEIEGSYNDAYLAYNRAYEVYDREYRKLFGAPPPNYLAEDVVRTGKLAGLGPDAERFGRKTGAKGETADLVASMGEVIFIHAGGEAPYKEQTSVTGRTRDGTTFRIALPNFRSRQPLVTGSVVEAAGKKATPDLAEPVIRIAMENFRIQKPVLTARAIARAAIKMAAAKGTEAAVGAAGSKTAGRILGRIVSTAGALAENADLRTWSLLPGYFRVARLWLPPGNHDLKVSFVDRYGDEAMASRTVAVQVGAGERKIISVRTIR